MSEIEGIRDQLKRGHQGEAWHGPSVLEALEGVSAEQATARPLDGAHTIWELVLHMAAWRNVARRRLEGERVDSIPDEEDFPIVFNPGADAWNQALAQLDETFARLDETLSRFDEGRLEDPVPERSQSYYTMLHGVVQHDIYHAGQIVLLRKAI
jgi:uncharacterized damage-inducible protein DinB